VYGAAVCDWVGVPADRVDPALLRDLGTIVDGFGSIGVRHVRASRARRRADRWASALIADLRRGVLEAAPGTAADVIATHHEPGGFVLPAAVAGVELLNILRPTVAAAYFAAFTGLALHEHPEWRKRLDGEATLEAFAQEVRRFYPFVPVLGAVTRRDVSWRGHQLRAGDRVILDVYGTLHDPAYWSDPGRFDPDRFLGGSARPGRADPARRWSADRASLPRRTRCPGSHQDHSPAAYLPRLRRAATRLDRVLAPHAGPPAQRLRDRRAKFMT
jgi:fatty-acid peroxygenase